MIKPSEKQLNRAMATVIWGCPHLDMQRKEADPSYIYHCRQCGADMDSYPLLPNYCGDRNLLPEIWEAIEKAGLRYRFTVEVSNAAHEIACTPDRINYFDKSESWFLATLPARQHVEAALRTLGKWPEGEWE